jgi:hypothetical protein
MHRLPQDFFGLSKFDMNDQRKKDPQVDELFNERRHDLVSDEKQFPRKIISIQDAVQLKEKERAFDEGFVEGSLVPMTKFARQRGLEGQFASMSELCSHVVNVIGKKVVKDFNGVFVEGERHGRAEWVSRLWLACNILSTRLLQSSRACQ